MSHLHIGCVADDFTGATDMASFLVKGGLNTEIVDGIPSIDWRPATNTQAVVIALKSRTAPVKSAVEQSLQCFDWLYNQLQAKQLFFKYCSTFDSTDEGNIGPVIDQVLAKLHLKNVIISPALPVNGRTVYLGHLFVNGVLLENSSMKNHPLTPMRQSNLMQLIEQQGSGKAFNLSHQMLSLPTADIDKQINELDDYQYLVVDHFNDMQADTIAKACANHPFLSGSSGLAEPIAKLHAQSSKRPVLNSLYSGNAPTLILAGSCSVATREQIKLFKKHYACFQIEPNKLISGETNEQSILQWIATQKNQPCLVYSSQAPDTINAMQSFATQNLASLIEKTFAQIATQSVQNGVKRLIVAGGETSGAITQALELSSFNVGASIAPGVPIIQSRDNPDLLLALKSGNFGGPSFFLDALALMNQPEA
jgi:uncharacterized protein YgbK (DUF1537 family)